MKIILFALDRPSNGPPGSALRFFISPLDYSIEGSKVEECEAFVSNQNALKFQGVLIACESLALLNFRALYKKSRGDMKKRRALPGGVFYFLCNLGKLAKRGGGGYPQALPKIFNLQIMLELSEILVLVGNPPPRSIHDNNNLTSDQIKMGRATFII